MAKRKSIWDELAGTAFGLHRHDCPECGESWEHNGLDTAELSREEYEDAHTCKQCGASSYRCEMPKTHCAYCDAPMFFCEQHERPECSGVHIHQNHQKVKETK